MDTESLVRVTILVNRKKGTTEEEFHRYWVGPKRRSQVHTGKQAAYCTHQTAKIKAELTRYAQLVPYSIQLQGIRTEDRCRTPNA
jgi:hypothetical protein